MSHHTWSGQTGLRSKCPPEPRTSNNSLPPDSLESLQDPLLVSTLSCNHANHQNHIDNKIIIKGDNNYGFKKCHWPCLQHQAAVGKPVGKEPVVDDSDPLLLHLHPGQAHHGQEPQDRHHRPVRLCHRSLQSCQVTLVVIMWMEMMISNNDR